MALNRVGVKIMKQPAAGRPELGGKLQAGEGQDPQGTETRNTGSESVETRVRSVIKRGKGNGFHKRKWRMLCVRGCQDIRAHSSL